MTILIKEIGKYCDETKNDCKCEITCGLLVEGCDAWLLK
jgi:hypothetical protein